MSNNENQITEFKRIATGEAVKAIIAFANSDGGTLYIGINDDGTIHSVSDVNEVLLKINNMIRDAIKPDITMFVDAKEKIVDGKSIVVVDVQRGAGRPYYIASKGIRPEGVFVRHGAASVPATSTAIRSMIKETDGDSYEAFRSTNQNLTFQSAENEFNIRNIEFGIPQMKTLGFMTGDGIYTNLGLLLSDQCGHTIKVAVFQDSKMNVIKDRREYDGSLFKQLEEAYAFIDMCNPTQSTFSGLMRIDTRNFPENAVREALLNALIHREYSLSGSTLVKVFPDRLEILSPGGLVSGIEPDDIQSGLSICRNQNLAGVFYRLRLIESYGIGIQKIFLAYEEMTIDPVFEITSNSFKLILPNINTSNNTDEIKSNNDLITDPKEQIFKYIDKHGSIRRKDVELILGISQSPAGQILKSLVDKGELAKNDQGKNTRYTKLG